uniref:Crumbs cell polarity complex component 2 n=1 Tax=Callorhinchus milii TaxID=7868 RepID=A0A4W3IZN4_CALMI
TSERLQHLKRSNGICYNGIKNYTCVCALEPVAYAGQNCELLFDACSLQPCLNAGVCNTTAGTLDTCASRPCQGIHVDCIDKADGYTCVCALGYGGENCMTEINECLSNPCGANRTCLDEVGNYTCICDPGNTGVNCETEINNCASNPCLNGALCINGKNDYKCFCVPGYQGPNCDIDINECASRPCRNGATCQNSVDRYICACLPGYTVLCSLTQTLCQSFPTKCPKFLPTSTLRPLCGALPDTVEIDECESAPCQHGATCEDYVAFYNCTCTVGYQGLNCEVDIDECASSPCVNTGVCVDGINSYTCLCWPGYTGPQCEVDIDECLEEPCRNNGTCMERSNQDHYKFDTSFSYSNASGYICLCQSGFTGENCSIDIDECESGPCVNQGICDNQVNGFHCGCTPGFKGVICEININECEDGPCENGGTCVDQIAEYTCNCPPMDKDGITWGGKNCSTQLTGCLGHSCENGATCFPYLANGVHNYTCKCPPGFYGTSCSTSTTFSLSNGYIIVERPDRNYSGRAPAKQLISISFRTTLPNGILVYQGDNDKHLYLELYSGQLMSSVRVNSEMVHIAFSEQVNDGQWHNVVIHLGQEFLVTLTHPNCPNSTCSDIRTTRGTVDSLLNSLTVMYVGGHSDASMSKKTKSKRNFTGCLRDVNIDFSIVLPQEISEYVAWNFTLGCQRTVWCQSDTCHGRGKCVDLWTSYWCSCIRPYTEHISGTFSYGNTNSSALFLVSDNPGSRFTFSFFIRTLKANSLLFEFIRNDTSPYLVMYLQQGHLSIKARGTTLQAVMNIADGVKRLIVIHFDGGLVSVTHSGSILLNNLLPMVQVRPLDSIHIGEDSSEQGEHFKGCLQDVRLNNNQLEFYPLEVENYTSPVSVYTSVALIHLLPNCISDNTCLSAPCQNGGNCSVTWNDYQCLCPKEFSGKACEDKVWCETVLCPAGSQCGDIPGGYECHANATFQGADPVVYIANNSITRDLTSISLELRTRERAGVLLQASNGADTMWLVFRNSRLLFQLKTGNSVEEGLSLSSHVNISDGLWHSVLVYMEEPSAQLSRWLITVNGQLDTKSAMAAGNLNFLRSDVNITLSSNFTGCLGIAKLGGIHLPYLQQTPPSLTEHFVLYSDPPAQIGCFGTEMCSPDPCQNNGTCQDLFESFRCACSPGWEGQRCQININECASGPCLHGNCTDVVDGYQCTCYQGYMGTNCEQDIDNCVGHLCQNGGSCIDGINSFFCTCPSNFTGQYCEWSYPPVDCGENFSCYHGGRCTDGIWGANCTCRPGFTGERCEKDINECVRNPCQNGGTCQNLVNRFECICGANFAGEQWAQAEPVPLAAVIVPVVCGSALLVVITLIFVVLTARKKRQTEGTYNPSQQEVAGARLEMDSVLKVPPEERLI